MLVGINWPLCPFLYSWINLQTRSWPPAKNKMAADQFLKIEKWNILTYRVFYADYEYILFFELKWVLDVFFPGQRCKIYSFWSPLMTKICRKLNFFFFISILSCHAWIMHRSLFFSMIILTFEAKSNSAKIALYFRHDDFKNAQNRLKNIL